MIPRHPQELTIPPCFLVYPCIGGTTRLSLVPHQALVEQGFIIVEFHPPAHGRSKGQMTMPRALAHLYRFLAVNGLASLPMVVLGHSAGCNALLQLHPTVLDIRWYFLAQPVFDFRQSMFYMYRQSSASEFLRAISRWCTDPGRLASILPDERWLDLPYWYQQSLCNKIDAMSKGIRLGEFLEDFYIPGYCTSRFLSAIRAQTTIFCSPRCTGSA